MKSTANVLSCVLLTVLGAWAWAQPQPQLPEIIALTLSPVAPDQPALRNRLVPFVGDQIPGNAAQLYLLAVVQLGSGDNFKDDSEKISQFLDCPLGKMNRDEAERLVSRYRGVLNQLEQASLRDACDWGLSIRQEGIHTVLPHLRDMRFLGRLIALQVRVDVAAARHDSALRWLRVGYAMVRHLNSQAVLIQGLVSAAIVSQINKAMIDFVQSPGAPNMYWPLMNLPRPMLDVGKMLEWERAWIYFNFPTLKEVRGASMTPQQWQNLVSELSAIGGPGAAAQGNPMIRQLGGALLGMQAFPRARDYLQKHGFSRDKLDQMPVSQVLGIYYVDSYESWCDELFKWAAVPHWQARPQLIRLEQELQQARDPGNPFMSMLPAVTGAFSSFAAVERELAALRTVESIRGYAAAHDGKLPELLENLPDYAEPTDPFTGRPFEWKAAGASGVLVAPTVPDDRRGRGANYEITIRK